MKGFYFITDQSLCTKSDLEAVQEAISGGARIIQYRDKDSPKDIVFQNAKKMAGLCRGKAIFLMNDYVDIAHDVGADGVHIGQDDMNLVEAREILGKDKIIGVTAHNVPEALTAARLGADYVAASPIFSTKTKLDAGAPSGVTLIKEIKKAVELPVCAIGGINRENFDDVLASGADMICAISATVCEQDIRAAVKYFAIKWTK